MNIFEMREALRQACNTIDENDRIVGAMAQMIKGRLRNSNATSTTLCALKKELANYNMHTGQWKD